MKMCRIITCLTIVSVLVVGCASTEETSQLRRSLNSIQSDVMNLRQDTDSRLAKITKDNDTTNRQALNMYSSMESNDEKIRVLMGKIDDLEFQLKNYWAETKKLIEESKRASAQPSQPVRPAQPVEAKYEDVYKDAFETFQRGNYEEAAKRFSSFIQSFPSTPLTSNAYYWLGESHLNLKNYDKAILYFQETVDKFPKSEKAPRALLSQAEAFRLTNDRKSSTTILKRITELYPKTEEAIIAERRLRNSGL
ncbi:MAG TPA: tol-pal system protein YbgF [Syntrophorhabdaceae bacterium]|nr:tol-pal system protein YbgF [Syntrophorhabdaceae bacterium]